MKLFDLYKSILDYAGLKSDDQGYISIKSVENKPSVINGARLVLPYPEQLKSINPSEKIIFHPLTENVMKGESEVIKKLRNNINLKLNASIGSLASQLLMLISSTALHSKMTPEQHEILLHVKGDVDEKAVQNFNTYLLNNIESKNDRLFVNIYLARGGTSNKKYARLGVVSFPFYKDLLEDKVEKFRVKDKAVIKQLFEFMFPGIGEVDTYSFGSDSRTAPFLESLMISSANVSSRLNELMDLYKDFIEMHEVNHFNLDWIDDFKDLDALTKDIRSIPPQHEAPAAPEVPVAPQAPQVPVAPVAPVPQTMAYQPQPQVPQAKPEPTYTKRGIDFNSSFGANPSLAMVQNPFVRQMYQPQQPMERVPSWAMPNMVPQQQMYPPQGYMQPYQPQMPYQQPYQQYPQQGYTQQMYPPQMSTI